MGWYPHPFTADQPLLLANVARACSIAAPNLGVKTTKVQISVRDGSNRLSGSSKLTHRILTAQATPYLSCEQSSGRTPQLEAHLLGLA